MLTTNIRVKVIGAIQSGLSLNQLIAILKIYYMREDFTAEELNVIISAYNKVVSGEINAANYMDFFVMLRAVKRTDRNDVASGLQDLAQHQEEINKLK